MNIEHYIWNDTEWKAQCKNSLTRDFMANLVLVFGTRMKLLDEDQYLESLKKKFPSSELVICSTAGNILNENLIDEHIVATAIEFETSKIKIVEIDNQEISDSQKGIDIGNQFMKQDSLAKLIMVFSDGQNVNGSNLIAGMNSIIDGQISITGGLAGDCHRFEKTLVGLNKKPTENKIVAIGFYGDDLEIGFSSKGGWDPFGPERIVTKSNENILMELDGDSALQIYKKYLGERAKDLPSSSLLFPLHLTYKDTNETVVRTVLSIDEDNQSMIFAGNIPEGSVVQLMKANFNKLIDGSIEAAEESAQQVSKVELAILVSCVGRRFVLGQKVDEELEEAQLIFGNKTKMAGFYSYGEISPNKKNKESLLHNQTMSITTFNEK